MAAERSAVEIIDAALVADLERDRPIRLQGLIDSWPALQWDQDELISRIGDLCFRLRPCATLHEYGFPGPAESHVSLRDYFRATASPAFGVLFENDFHAAHRALGGFCRMPPLLQKVHGSPIFSAGRRHTGVGFHRHNESWLAQLRGRKAWLLVPPDADRPVALPPWWYLKERPPDLMVCVLHPGEVLFLPSGWWHATWNLDDFTVAFGWEGGASAVWGPEMHAIADGDMKRLIHWGLHSADRATSAMAELAARGGHTEVLRWLLREDADVGLGENGTPAALKAARGGHLAVLEILLRCGYAGVVDSSDKRSDSITPLHEASRCGQVDAAVWLLQHRADASMRNSDGFEPVHLAAFYGHCRVVDALLAAGVFCDAPDGKGSAPLLHAAFNGHAATAELLLAARASLSTYDALRMTPLHVAALRGHSVLVGRLLELHADHRALDTERRAPLHLCAHGYEDMGDPRQGVRLARNSNFSAAKVLLEAGADLSLCDAAGMTPADYALVRDHRLLASLLLQRRLPEAAAAAPLAAVPAGFRSLSSSKQHPSALHFEAVD